MRLQVPVFIVAAVFLLTISQAAPTLQTTGNSDLSSTSSSDIGPDGTITMPDRLVREDKHHLILSSSVDYDELSHDQNTIGNIHERRNIMRKVLSLLKRSFPTIGDGEEITQNDEQSHETTKVHTRQTFMRKPLSLL